MTSKQPSPRQRRQVRTRQAILDAARQIVTEKGASGLSLREVARRIDYSPAGLYEYFGSKDEILAAVRLEGQQRFAQHLLGVDKSLDAFDYLVELGLAYVRFGMKNPEHFMLLFSTLLCNIDGKTFAQGREEQTFKTLVDGLERAQVEGIFPESHDIQVLSLGIWSMVHGLTSLLLTNVQLDDDWELMARSLLVTCMNGFRLDPDQFRYVNFFTHYRTPFRICTMFIILLGEYKEMQKFIHNLQKYATTRAVFGLFVVTMLVFATILWVTIPAVLTLAPDMALFDMSPAGYSVEYASELLGAIGAEGRQLYLTRQLPVDFIYPGLFAIGYTLLLTWLFKKGFAQDSSIFYVVFVPMLAGLFDYFENIGIILMLNSYPNISPQIVAITSMNSIIKSGLTVAFYCLLMFGIIMVARNKVRPAI